MQEEDSFETNENINPSQGPFIEDSLDGGVPIKQDPAEEASQATGETDEIVLEGLDGLEDIDGVDDDTSLKDIALQDSKQMDKTRVGSDTGEVRPPATVENDQWPPPQQPVLDAVYAASVSEPNQDQDLENESAKSRMSIAGYELGSEISRGGQAVVYHGRQMSTGQRVAIKVMRNGPFASEDQKARFDREVQCLASLNHPNIVGIIDCGQTPEGFFYYVMEFIEGRTLDDYAAELRGKTPPADIPQNPSDLLRLFMRICDAVNVAHQQGVVHRDLKPSNILIDKNGEPRILDFGLAQRYDEAGQRVGQPLTITGEFLGSLPWASPEQAESDPDKIDARTDVYALGVILFQILTNEFPYEVVGNMAMVLHNIINKAPRSPSRVMDARIAKAAQRAKRMKQKLQNPINKEMEAIILRALAKRRENRYEDAGALSRELSAYLSGMATYAGTHPGKNRKSYKWVAGLGLILVLSSTALGAYYKPEFFPKPVQDFVQQLAQRETQKREASEQPSNAIVATLPETKPDLTIKPQQAEQLPTPEKTNDAVKGAKSDRLPKVDLEPAIQKPQDLKTQVQKPNRKPVNAPNQTMPAPLKPVPNKPIQPSESVKQVKPEVRVPVSNKDEPVKAQSLRPKPGELKTDTWQPGDTSPWQQSWAKKHGVPVVKTNQLGMKFILIPPGEVAVKTANLSDSAIDNLSNFKGVPIAASFDDKHRNIKINRPFYMSVSAVSLEHCRKLMPELIAQHDQPDAMMPALQLDWFECMAFAYRLGRQAKQRYRLPTAAEWTYVAQSMGTYQSALAQSASKHIYGQRPGVYGIWGLGNGQSWCLGLGAPYFDDRSSSTVHDRIAFEFDHMNRLERQRLGNRHTWRALQGHLDGQLHFAAADYLSREVSFHLVLESDLAMKGHTSEAEVRDLENQLEASDKLVQSLNIDHPGNHWEGLTLASEANKIVGRIPEAQRAVLRLEGYGKLRKSTYKLSDEEVVRTVYLPSGDFLMGSLPRENGRENDENQRRTHLSYGFEISETEVTRGQWVAVMGHDQKLSPSPVKDASISRELPATGMSWEDASIFCKQLSRLTGRVFDLPTEAQWEYAARAGRVTPYADGWRRDTLPRYGNFADYTSHPELHGRVQVRHDGYGTVAPVGRYRPNDFGLYDMQGNVMEWCRDYYGDYSSEQWVDPMVRRGTHYVLRGGGWGQSPNLLRFAARQAAKEGVSSEEIGFRVVLEDGDKTERRLTRDWMRIITQDKLGSLQDVRRELRQFGLPESERWQKDVRALDRKISTYEALKTVTTRGMTFIQVPPGQFQMGSNQNEPGHRRDEGIHDAALARPLWVGVHEVTQAQFEAFVKAKGLFWRAKRQMPGVAQKQLHELPATGISFDQAVQFTTWLSEQDGVTYRLPTELEWEYFARAGQSQIYPWGNELALESDAVLQATGKHAPWQANPMYGNGLDISRRHIHPFEPYFPWSDSYPALSPVGQFRANAFGLQDIFGNAAEWTSSVYRGYPYRAGDGREDPRSRERRVLRGFMSTPAGSRIARRIARSPDEIVPEAGIRLVIDEME